MIDDPALLAVFLADLHHWSEESSDRLPSIVANRLIDLGHPEIVAVRVALTPPLSFTSPAQGGAS